LGIVRALVNLPLASSGVGGGGRSGVPVVVVLAGASLLASGCGVSFSSTHHSHQAVVHRAYRILRAGHAGVVRSPKQHAALRVTVSVPTVSSTRLSPTYGVPPAHGHYVTFRVRVVDTGKVPIEVRRLDFFLRTQGAARTTTDDGNAPASGSGSQLDTTELEPGQRVANDLTFDVAKPRGTLFYAPAGRVALAWRFGL
jgi:hypothetical protein